MSTFCKNEWKPAGWSLVAGKFKGTSKTYFYLIRGNLMCSTPLTLQCPASEDGFVYSNPFTIEHVLARFGSQIEQDTMLKLGRSLPPKKDLRILVGDELRDVTSSYFWGDIEIDPEKGSPKLKEAVEDWRRTWIGDPSPDTVTVEVKNVGGLKIMDMNAACNCRNEDMGMKKSALGEVLFYWHDEVHDRIGEIIGHKTTAVRNASTKKVFVDQLAAQIVEFERQGGEDTAKFEAMAERRADRLCSLLMDWVEVPRKEADQVLKLDRVLKAARDRLEEEFESLFVRAKVVQPGDETGWLRAVGVYHDGFDFNVEGDARRFIRMVSDDFVEL